MRSRLRAFAGVLTACVISVGMFAPVASANFHLGLHGVYYAHPHHWYTNDSSREARDLHELESIGGRHHEHELEIPKDSIMIKCEELHVRYILRHGATTPEPLRIYHGCKKWEMDQEYWSKTNNVRHPLPSIYTAINLF